ncbi:MAG: WGR domain-containing protein [Kofleriaceae bacterium]
MAIARYEYTDGSSSKFWQIELSGASFTTTHGKIGSSGQTLLKQWPDAATAKREHDKLIAQKTKKGYAPVSTGKPAARPKADKPAAKAAPKAKAAAPVTAGAYNAALAKVIDADPTDDGAWSVYADWLQSQGDPRGELAAVQERLRAQPKDKALLAAEKKLLKDHAAQLVGEIAVFMTRAGKPDIPGVTIKPKHFEEGPPPLRVQWKSGFFSRVTVGHPGYDWSPFKNKVRGASADDSDNDDDGGGIDLNIDVTKLLKDVLASPAARFVTSLRLATPNDPDDGECDYAPLLKKIGDHEALRRLRSLYIGDISQEESELSWIEIGDISKLYPQLKNLRKLTLRGNSRLKLGTIALPALRELTIITGGLDKKNLAAILAARWPKLEKLELSFGQSNYGSNCKLKDLAPLLDGKAFPKLEHLGLTSCEFADELAAVLPTAKIVKQLQTLDLSGGTLTDTGVQALAPHKDAFTHLKRIDLSENFITKKASNVAASLAPAVRTKPQREADEYDGEVHRYAVLGE